LRALAAASILVASALTAVLLSAGSAAATSKSVVCTSLTGNLTINTFTLGGCDGNTGGGGTASGRTITWTNGESTDLLDPAFSLPAPGKPARCGSSSERFTIRDRVAFDLTGSIKVGGELSAKVCVLRQAPDPWSLAPGSVVTLR